jgi:4-diphosphocytidyl-2-C-methyl-D-erythritol kinase
MPEALLAPAKLNLCLFLGARRDDGLHRICSLFEPLTLADMIEVEAVGDKDEVICPGVEGENLAARALTELRESGWGHPPLRVRIEKRIPVAAGLGGGSADAAAVLRLARGDVPELEQVAAKVGADVPSQLLSAMALVQGAGERVRRLPAPEPHGVVLLPSGGGLSTADVFAEADRLELGRSEPELGSLGERLLEAAGSGASPLAYAGLLVNDLEPAALALRPEIGDAIWALRDAGARLAAMTGSGPTAFGVFADLGSAQEAAARLGRDDAIVCEGGVTP